MEITEVKPIVCDAGWRPWIFVKVVADDGTAGYGECTDNRSPLAVLGAIADFKDLLLGRDPRHVEMLYWDMYRATCHSVGGVVQKAIAGINCALVDLKARALGIPVYELYGGPTRKEVRVYWTHLGTYRMSHAKHLGTPDLKSVDDIARLALAAKRKGFTALKTNALNMGANPPTPVGQGFGGGFGTTDRNLSAKLLNGINEVMGAIRQAVGPDVDIAIDLNFHFTPAGNVRIAHALEPHEPAWIEIDSRDPAALLQVKNSTRIPLCSGEALYTAREYRPFFERRALDFAMLDVPWNGFTASKKVADFAETYEINVCPHNYYSHLATSMSAHLCASVPNVQIMECEIEDVPWKDDIVSEVPRITNGFLEVPDGPGWGMELRESEIAKHPWPH